MIVNIYAVKDILVGFNAPFTMPNDQFAKRSFLQNVMNRPEKDDLQLWKIGSFDDETGLITNNVPEMLSFSKEDKVDGI